MAEPIIGIDLGTTNSLCAYFSDDGPILIPNAHNEFLTPSVVGLAEDDSLLVGAAARELRVTQPHWSASCFKRFMGTDKKITLGKSSYSPIELSSIVLKSLKNDASEYLKADVKEAVITVPAYFNDNQRKATKQAGEMAGLKVRRIINEPTAAALTYGFHDREAEKHLLVIDLGGGTFDVTLMEVFEGTLEIISTAGESMLGGEDFTDRIVSTVLQKEGNHLETAELKQPLRVARLRQECESAKRKLALSVESTIRVPDQGGEFSPNCKKFKLTRDTFASVCKPLFERLSKPIGKTMRDGKIDPEQVNDIILVGGSTRMPALQDAVQEMFNRKPQCEFDPDQVVALGAAVQAALIADNHAVNDMVMTDVCPFTLGVEVAKQFGSRIDGGYFQPVIHRNTTIPVSKEEIFSTISPNQDEVRLRVFQGEARKIDDNLDLGELLIKDIPPGPAGQEIQVRFTYDINGILEVEAIVSETGRRYTLVLTQHAAALSDDEVEEAVERMQNLKFYPRDDLENKKLLLFCERMVGEVSPVDRETLEMAIDVFVSGMESGDRSSFERAKSGLMITLSSLGIEYDEQDRSEK